MSAAIPIASPTKHRKWRPPAGPYRIFISTPCDDGHKLCFWDSLRALEHACRKGWTKHQYRVHATPGDSLIPRARNNHAHNFYYSTVDDFILKLDSDLDFRVADVEQLFENPYAIMAGKYAIKQQELRWCLNQIPGQVVDPITQREFVSTAGTGFLAAHRHTIGTLYAEAHKWRSWPIRYNDDFTGAVVHDIFHNGVIKDLKWFPEHPVGRYMSEDWGFCYLARKHGFPIVCDHRCIALHEGGIKYPLNMRRLSAEEERAGTIQQPDGTVTPIK